jgi:hypothetical protein
MKFQATSAVTMKFIILCNVTPCSLVDKLAPGRSATSSSTLNMEATDSSKLLMLVYWITWYVILLQDLKWRCPFQIPTESPLSPLRGRVNKSQMDIKRNTYEYSNRGGESLFLDTSSTNIDTTVPSLYQCVETRSTEVFWLLSQPIPHLRFNLFVISEIFATQLWTALRDKHFQP